MLLDCLTTIKSYLIGGLASLARFIILGNALDGGLGVLGDAEDGPGEVAVGDSGYNSPDWKRALCSRVCSCRAVGLSDLGYESLDIRSGYDDGLPDDADAAAAAFRPESK